MSLKHICFTILLFLTLTKQLNLIPDKNNPLVIDLPTKASNPTVQIKFSFAAKSDNELGIISLGSSGITYGQFIGLQFPYTLNSLLNFDQSLKWSCQLSDGTYNYNLKAVLPASSSLSGSTIAAEKNIAYCQLIDNSINVPLKTGPGITYTLKITLNKSVLISFTRGLSLFTSTSNTPDKLIIDSLPQIGSFALYDNWTLNNDIPVTISSADLKVISGFNAENNLIYPESIFDIQLKITCSAFLRAVDHVIVINYPVSAVTPPVSVDSTDVNSKYKNQLALKGALTLLQFGENSLLLNGISEDLDPGRTFYLNLKGLVALKNDIENTKELEIYVYYKNTYSVISYSSNSFIRVNKGSLIVSVNHPEYWDIYRNAAWPIKFSFISKINLNNHDGLYVAIRHNNAIDESANGGNIVTFLASTCDFSDNSSFDNSFGNRPSCYPLRLDHKYSNSSTTKIYNGSGIFFYFPGPIVAEKYYFVTVWLYADNCGGLYFNNISGSANTIPSFEVSIHKEIKTNYLNEERFDFTKVLADGIGRFSGKCWNNKIQSFSLSNSEVINVGDNNFKSDIQDNVNDVSPSLTLRFKEIYSWRIGSSSQSGYLNDISRDIEEKFIFSSSNAITSDSFFVVEADLNLGSGSKLNTGLPGSYQYNNQLPGFLTVQFSKNWFTGTNYFMSTGTDIKCYLSWALANPPTSNALNSKILSINVNNSSYSTYSNFIGAAGHNSPDFDETQSNLVKTADTTNTRSNIMRLVSQRNGADGSKVWKYFPNELPVNSKTKVAWSTNCLNWNPTVQIKSLFTYIDIQFIWTYSAGITSNANVGIFSNVRLIKLFPEGGVFHDKRKFAGIAPSQNPYINHVVLGNPENGPQSAVCLVEINGKAISDVASGDSNSNVMALWLGFGMLLETDYSDASTTYPVGNLVDSATPFGLQSQTPMNPQNLYISENYTTENLPLFVVLRELQNPYIFGDSSGVPQKGENTSSSHFLMGSVLLITGLSNGTIQNTSGPIFIPYYCPYSYPKNNYPLRAYLNFAPSLFGAWLTMENHANISNLNRYLYYGDSDGNGGVINKISVILSRLDSSKTIKTGPYKGYGQSAYGIEYTNRHLATLRWNAYTDDNDYTLSVYNGVKGFANSSYTCTGFSIFLNLNSVTLDNNVKFTIFDGKLGYYNSARVFYISGNRFTTAAFWGGLSIDKDATIGNLKGKDPATDASSFQITGITRPLLESFINEDDELVVSNKVGFSCAPADTSEYHGVTNYLYVNNSPNFILDFTPSTNGNWDVNIEYDHKNNYFPDVAGNIGLKITTPDTVPSGAVLVVNSSTFTKQTICGIVQGKFAQDCESTDAGFKCGTPFKDTHFDICCYNIRMAFLFDITNLKVDFQTQNQNTNIKEYLSDYIYSAVIKNGDEEFNIPLNNSNAENVVITKPVSVLSVTYDQSYQLSGIGKITLTIVLPREPTKNMILTINGNFKDLIVQGISPKCLVSFSNDGVFGSNWDSGDAIIDSCALSNSKNQLLISTKNFVYKCGQSFLKNLYISLWPVLLINWNDSIIDNNFQITLKNINGDALALEAKNIKLKLINSLKAAPIITGQWDTLCTVSSVTPKLPGEIADYVFDIDLDTNAAQLTDAKPNEVTIFWPFNLYGSFLNNINCLCKNQLLNCYFTDEGILNIRFNSDLLIGSGNKIPITVTGVRNPESSNDIFFLCTINQSNLSSGERINLITGSGKLSGGITYFKVTQTGNLRFLSVNKAVSNQNPRETSTHTFRISFDRANGLTTFPIIINKTPIIYVYFPEEYKLIFLPNQISVSIDEYRNDPDNSIINKKTFTPSEVTCVGNRVKIILKEESIDFDDTFRYWEIIISNVVNPFETTESIKAPVSLTTSPYYLTLTNSEETVLYTIFTNINTYASEVISGLSFSLISWSRGNYFNYDKSKWVVDIYSTETQLNKLLIKPGRYSLATFRIRSYSNVPHAAATLTLTDNIFSIAQKSGYDVVTAFKQSYNFLIGTPCGTLSGYYLTKFALSNYTNFAPLSPVVVMVDSSTKGIVSFINPSSVPIGGSTLIYISINDFNYDKLNINWTVPTGFANDESATISKLVIYPNIDISNVVSNANRIVGKSLFSITSTKAPLSPQVYQAADPNNCWTFNGQNSLSINITGRVPQIGLYIDLTNSFKYTDASRDNSLDKNSVKFQFIPPVYPIYLYCALACSNNNFPADVDIIIPKIDNSNLLQFYSALYNDNKPSDIIFSNLVRGQAYKLRCLAQSIEGDATKRSQVTVNLENPVILGSEKAEISFILPVVPSETKCVQWNFPESSKTDYNISLLSLCQNIYSNGDFYSNGCVVCTNSVASEYVSGISKPSLITCKAASRLRFLESTDSNTNANTIINLPRSYTVCPVATQVCKTDVGPIKNYNDLFSKYVQNTSSNANIVLDSQIQSKIYSDMEVPILTQLNINVTNSKLNGEYTFTANANDPLRCYWQISTNDKASPPNLGDLMSCIDSWCGTIRVGTIQNSFTSDSTKLKPFSYDVTYNLFFGCTNDVPFPKKFSEVAVMNSINFPKPPPAVNHVSRLLSYSSIALIIFMALLF